MDATCPNVLRVQQIVAQADAEGRVPIIIGDPNHPEVMGVASWSARSVVFEGAETLQRWLDEDPARRELPLTAVAQTTCHPNYLGWGSRNFKKTVYKRENL